jgi:microcystin-dependent protein
MSNPFVAEIRMFAGNFAPRGWAQCDGQLMPISQNTALFSLLGTTYGGDGKSTFALPNLQGAAPMQQGQGPGLTLRDLGETGGEANVTLLQTEIPSHSHTMNTTTASGATATSTNNELALAQAGGGKEGGGSSVNFYSTNLNNLAQMGPFAIKPTGGNQPHYNLMPYLGITFIIALQGVFPPRG